MSDFATTLTKLGVDMEDALKRFANNSALYERMYRKFIDTLPTLEVLPYLEAGDYEKALENAHTLKGLTGNLSIMPLYKAYTDIVAFLRVGKTSEALDTMEETLSVQEKFVAFNEEQ